jgi:uncharacterized sporulation protein YeaH/YhbH (DUF444 family)
VRPRGHRVMDISASFQEGTKKIVKRVYPT